MLYECVTTHARDGPFVLPEDDFRRLLRDPRLTGVAVPLVEGETLRVRDVFGVSLDVTPDVTDDGQRVVLDCTLREGRDLVDVGATTIPMGSARVWRLNGRLLILYVPSIEPP